MFLQKVHYTSFEGEYHVCKNRPVKPKKKKRVWKGYVYWSINHSHYKWPADFKFFRSRNPLLFCNFTFLLSLLIKTVKPERTSNNQDLDDWIGYFKWLRLCLWQGLQIDFVFSAITKGAQYSVKYKQTVADIQRQISRFTQADT